MAGRHARLVHEALDRFDRRFASGDADSLAELFADDARLLLLYQEPLEGRAAIRTHWATLFADWDPGDWRAEHDVVDVHGDRAYSLSTYAETLRKRDGTAAIVVRGRLVHFLRRDPDGTWRVTLAVNSHSRPSERLEHDPGASPD